MLIEAYLMLFPYLELHQTTMKTIISVCEGRLHRCSCIQRFACQGFGVQSGFISMSFLKRKLKSLRWQTAWSSFMELSVVSPRFCYNAAVDCICRLTNSSSMWKKMLKKTLPTRPSFPLRPQQACNRRMAAMYGLLFVLFNSKSNAELGSALLV